MIPNKEKEGCHYFAVKELFTLLHGITSTTKIGEHIPCRYSILIIWAFNDV